MDLNYDDDDDRDHPLQEPEFVIHAVDDDRCRRAPAPPPLLPMQQPPPPQYEPGEEQRNAARIERFHWFMLFPQSVLTSWSMLFGCMLIFFAASPDNQPEPRLIWTIVMVGLIMLFMSLSLLLSYLGVYVYDRYPGLNDWLNS